jgi:hypothetical protein
MVVHVGRRGCPAGSLINMYWENILKSHRKSIHHKSWSAAMQEWSDGLEVGTAKTLNDPHTGILASVVPLYVNELVERGVMLRGPAVQHAKSRGIRLRRSEEGTLKRK